MGAPSSESSPVTASTPEKSRQMNAIAKAVRTYFPIFLEPHHGRGQ